MKQDLHKEHNGEAFGRRSSTWLGPMNDSVRPGDKRPWVTVDTIGDKSGWNVREYLMMESSVDDEAASKRNHDLSHHVESA